ncbi:MAG: hypothetical protein HYU30_09120 [Chloroflexi bacterium]|nr:hypothetical protein [Chloroflexota bacterium]
MVEKEAGRNLFAIQAVEESGLPTFFAEDAQGAHSRIGTPADKHWRGIPQGDVLELALCIRTTAIPEAQLESIDLEVMGRRIALDWESQKVVHVDRWPYFYVPMPDWVTPGVHTMRLIGNFNGQEVPSPDFSIEVPKR